MFGFTILYGISKGTFEISRKNLNPMIAKYAFYWHILAPLLQMTEVMSMQKVKDIGQRSRLQRS